MNLSDLSLYHEGSLKIVTLLGELEKAHPGKRNATTYKGITSRWQVPLQCAMRWVREARADGLVQAAQESSGGRLPGGKPRQAAWELTEKGKALL